MAHISAQISAQRLGFPNTPPEGENAGFNRHRAKHTEATDWKMLRRLMICATLVATSASISASLVAAVASAGGTSSASSCGGRE